MLGLKINWDGLLDQVDSAALGDLAEKGVEIWLKGGWAMIALAFISLFIFAIGVGVSRRLRSKRFGRITEAEWRLWIVESKDREGPMGELFDHVDEVVEGGRATVHDAFDEIRAREIEPFVKDLKLMKIAVSAAPLVGLLGTVTGMLATFNALAAGSGGDKTMSKIAEGISEALYTTETGLVVALPGLFFHYFLSRRFDRYRSFLAHVEAVWAQDVISAGLGHADERRRELVRSITHVELKRRIQSRLKTAGA